MNASVFIGTASALASSSSGSTSTPNLPATIAMSLAAVSSEIQFWDLATVRALTRLVKVCEAWASSSAENSGRTTLTSVERSSSSGRNFFEIA